MIWPNWLRWPLVWRSTMEDKLKAGAAMVTESVHAIERTQERADDLVRLEQELAAIKRNMPSEDLIDLARFLGGDQDLKRAAYRQRMTKRNNVEIKLSVAHVIQQLRKHANLDGDFLHMLDELELMGCVSSDDLEALERAGDRFALEHDPGVVTLARPKVES